MELIVVTGLSGAGKSSALHVIEDLEYECVDNLPAELIPDFVELSLHRSDGNHRIAIGADIRSHDSFSRLIPEIRRLKGDSRLHCRVLFFDASTSVILRRYKESRRPHPLAAHLSGSIEDVVEYERKALLPMLEVSDCVIDTSTTTGGQMARLVRATVLGQPVETALRILSFGYKNGLPQECDFIFDMRALPNPFYKEELKRKTGLDAPVVDYLFSFPQTTAYLQNIETLLKTVLPFFEKEGRASLSIGIGCTGGQHRSVAVAERLALDLTGTGRQVTLLHRDVGPQR